MTSDERFLKSIRVVPCDDIPYALLEPETVQDIDSDVAELLAERPCSACVQKNRWIERVETANKRMAKRYDNAVIALAVAATALVGLFGVVVWMAVK